MELKNTTAVTKVKSRFHFELLLPGNVKVCVWVWDVNHPDRPHRDISLVAQDSGRPLNMNGFRSDGDQPLIIEIGRNDGNAPNHGAKRFTIPPRYAEISPTHVVIVYDDEGMLRIADTSGKGLQITKGLFRPARPEEEIDYATTNTRNTPAKKVQKPRILLTPDASGEQNGYSFDLVVHNTYGDVHSRSRINVKRQNGETFITEQLVTSRLAAVHTTPTSNDPLHVMQLKSIKAVQFTFDPTTDSLGLQCGDNISVENLSGCTSKTVSIESFETGHEL